MMKCGLKDPAVVAKRMFWLAWQACGGPLGMGVLQDNPGGSEDDVWANVLGAADYPGNPRDSSVSAPYGDYVFGRMMKLGITVGDDFIDVPDRAPDPEYQAWCSKYPSYADLLEAAVADLVPC